VAQPWPIRKGAVWWLRSRDREGTAQVVLQAMMAPDLL
jgi:phosphohistidine phosphatase